MLSRRYWALQCAYGLYQQFTALGQECVVDAPSLFAVNAENKMKDDWRAGIMLAELRWAAKLAAVWVPDAAQTAMRDLVRTRPTTLRDTGTVRRHLQRFLLRRRSNPIENISQYLRQNDLANRVFDTYGAILAARWDAWKALVWAARHNTIHRNEGLGKRTQRTRRLVHVSRGSASHPEERLMINSGLEIRLAGDQLPGLVIRLRRSCAAWLPRPRAG